MPTERGYVEKLGVGRAGLVEASVMHPDNSTATYMIADLDADPERFNERLSKLGILRDAMDRAEPVEIEFAETDDDVRAIDGVMRITRDELRRNTEGGAAEGLIVAIGAAHEPVIFSDREVTDRVQFFLLTDTGLEAYSIPVQYPERATARAMIDIARDAYASGTPVSVGYDAETFYVTTILRQQAAGFTRTESVAPFSAFVEEITHTPASTLMRVEVTTAPEFQGDGNVVPLGPFAPERRVLAVIYQSPEYELLEAALRDRLRVELHTSRQRRRIDGEDGEEMQDNVGRDREEAAIGSIRREAMASLATAMEATPAAMNDSRVPLRDADVYMLRGVTLQHALCSATRPVWIEINRRALDVGPEEECAEGLPSSDMRPRTIRELDLPYVAVWIGHGCFNHGVYRIQIATDRSLRVLVDGEEICLHAGDDGEAWFGHACLDGDHEVQVEFEDWRCRATFDMDMYRIR